MNIGTFIKNLAASRAIKGLLVAGSSLLSLLATDVIPNVPAEALGPYGPAIKIGLGALGVGGLGYSAYGRVNAQGPITDQPQPPAPSALQMPPSAMEKPAS